MIEVDSATIRASLREKRQAIANARLGSSRIVAGQFGQISPRDRSEPAPLSYGQERLWLLDCWNPESSVFNSAMAFRLQGDLDSHSLQLSLEAIVERHESLRSIFPLVSDQPVQVVLDRLDLMLAYIDLSTLDEIEREREKDRLILEEACRPFDLANGPLIRSSLLHIKTDEHILLLTLHHIVTDGWSRGVLIRELAQLYESFSQGKPNPLPPLRIQFADYAVWQRTWLKEEALERELEFWRRHLLDSPALLNLPTDRPRPPVASYHGARKQVVTPAELADHLNNLSKSCNATLHMTLLAALYVLLSRYSGQEDIVVGTPVANRTHRETEGLIGFLTNILALRGNLSGDPSFRELLSRVRITALEAYTHQDIPFEMLLEDLQPDRSLSHSPLFQVNFVLHPPDQGSLELKGLTIEPIEVDRSIAKIDLMLSITQSPHGLEIGLEYNTDLFDEDRMQRLLGHFETILEGVVTNPDTQISHLQMLSQSERDQLLAGWNDTAAEYPRDRCVHELFEEKAARTPDAVAVIFDERSLTYSQLNARANQLAHYLIRFGIGPESLVGICLDRSPQILVALLGILKSGAAYVPLDPAYPLDRLAFMLGDSQVSILLSQASYLDTLPSSSMYVVCLDSDKWQIESESEDNPESNVMVDNLAYVIYTSGSTGTPKGVLLSHKGLSNVSTAQATLLGIGEGDRILQFASLSFDASVFEIVMAVTLGATLCMGRNEALMPGPDLALFLDECEISVATLPPTALQALPFRPYPTLKTLLVAGEACTSSLTLHWSPGRRFFNLYGPTEATIWSSYAECLADTGTVPIGRPVWNTRLYVLDRNCCPSPIGVAGELYIGGDGLARGYLNRPDLTAERFVPDPFSVDVGARLYRTGDLVRYRSDGNLDYLGRIDHQVKIRGFRIELGEIESALLTHASVDEAVVLVREDVPGDKRLVAYIGSDAASEIEPGTLQNHLKAVLPEYMVPYAFVILEALPLTPSGKINRKALPIPDANVLHDDTYVAPRTPIEQGMAEIWSSVLHVERVGIESSFFELGGHSLLATQVMSRIRSTFGVDLPLHVLFEATTITALTQRMAQAQSDNSDITPPLERVSRDATLPLSFSQQRLWFIHQMEPDSPAYNVPVALKITALLDEDALEQSLNEIVRRHEPLRTAFAGIDGVATQLVNEHTPRRLQIVDLSGLDEEARMGEANRLMEAEAQRPFDIERGVYRASMLRMGAEEYILLITIHHIASDGWSLGVLTRELKSLYKAFREGQPSPLPELTIQYVDFAAWQRNWLQGDALDRQLAYWRDRLAGAPTLLELPADRPRPAVQSFRCARRKVTLPTEMVKDLLALGRREGVTLFMTLFAAFQTLLYRYSGQEDMLIGSPIANRTRIELEGLIGFFVNMLTLRCDLSGDPSFRELLGRVRETTLGAYAHQDLPFESLVEELMPDRSLSHMPICQVVFVLQNAPGPDQVDGLAIETIAAPGMRGKFDLQFTASESETGLVLSAMYSTDLFDDDRIERLLGHYQTLLEAIITNQDNRISCLPLMTAPEREQVLVEWNTVKSEFAVERCIHEIFEDQASSDPDAVALKFEENELTYSQLNMRANQLAHLLRQMGVRPDDLVGVYLDRSLEMVIGVLGILKAGGAYVPMDPSYPSERLTYMVSDARLSIVVTCRSLAVDLPAPDLRIVCVDDDGTLSSQSTVNPSRSASFANLAYVIYTSGSTGNSKGALIPHSNVVRLMAATEEWFRFDSRDVWTLFHSLAFDFSVWELWGPLLYGGKLVVVPYWVSRSPIAFYELLQSEAVTILNQTPSAFRQLLATLPDDSPALTLRRVIFGGEALEPASLQRWYELYGADDSRLINMYGITETTVHVTYRPMCSTDVTAGKGSLIGCAIPDLQIYLLGPSMQPVPVGIVGEIYVGGEGLARGYLGRPELTADRFVPNPFAIKGGARLYRTGDLARYLPNGDLEYIGRTDHQVKIRGFRIELGEIENALMQHPGVQEAAVLAREDNPGDRRLAAYVVAERSALAALDEFRDAETEQTSDWQAVFDAYYAEPNPEEDPRFNIKGWDSSFTGLPIPAQEMAEWVNSTVASILALKPERVVEIGCGTGLLLFRIYPHCAEYVATDFSGEVIEYLRQVLAHQPEPATQVVLQQKEARAFADVGEEAPDTVIINSVVQYLPSVDYLMEVLEKAVGAVASGGRIFLGDIRSFAMLEEFQSAVQLSQAPDTTERHRLWQRIKQAVAEEGELLLDPAFFYALRERLPRIVRVDVQAKRGRHWNEMTCFRYDVVLHVGTEAPSPVDATWFDWTREGMSISSLRSLLKEGPDIVAVAGIPSARTADAVLAHRMLSQGEDQETVSDIRAAIATQSMPSVDPEQMWALGDEYPYSVQICPSGIRYRGCVDALLRRRNSADEVYVEFPGHSVATRTAYASDPLRGKLMATFVPQLRRFIEQRLPEYMVPASFVLLETLPLTPNGKVDRKALPAPDGARPELESTYESPQTPAEVTLAGIWSDVLRIERVGIHDNFFELGGDSILSIQIIARANQAGLKLSPRQIFQQQTIADLARVAGTGATMHAQQTELTGSIPLTPIQHWFFETNSDHPQHFNQARLLTLRSPIDPEIIEAALKGLITRHDALRLRFVQTDCGWQQSYSAPDNSAVLERIDLTAMDQQGDAITRECERLQASLNLQEGPLLRAAHFNMGPQQPARLFLVVHHLAVDGVSWRILLADLTAGLQQLTSGECLTPAPKTTSVQYWATRLQEYADTDTLRQQLDYWLSDARRSVRPLPTDYAGAANVRSSQQMVRVSLNEAQTSALLHDVPSVYHTQINDLLLTALAETICSWTGEREVLVDLEGHGREPLFEDVDLSRTTGWFTSLFPVLLDIGAIDDPGSRLKAIKEQLRAIPERGLGYGLLRYMCGEAEVRGALKETPQAQVSFNYHGHLDQVIEDSGLFEVGKERTGDVASQSGLRSYSIDVLSNVSGGRLHVGWHFSSNEYERATIERLAAGYIAHLASLIEHCQSANAGGFTPSDFPDASVSQQDLDLLPKSTTDVYALSSMQAGLLFLNLYSSEVGVYLDQIACAIEGDLDSNHFDKTWQHLSERHTVLRTSFHWEVSGEPLQVVHDVSAIPIEYRDWRNLSKSEHLGKQRDLLAEDRQRGIDLTQAPLMRLTMVRTSINTWLMLLSIHHLVIDRWSLLQLLSELKTAYEAIDNDRRIQLPRVRPYRDYIHWLREQDPVRAEAYWRRTLAGFTAPTALCIDRAPGGVTNGGLPAFQQVELSEETVLALQSLARRHHLTLNTFIQGAWALLLSHYSGEEDVLFGATVAGRPGSLEGVESIVGLFINTLPMRVRTPRGKLLLSWLQEFQRDLIEMRDYEYSSLVHIQNWSDAPRGVPLFDSTVTVQNIPVANNADKPSSALKIHIAGGEVWRGGALSLTATPGQGALRLTISYDIDRYQSDDIARMVGHLSALMEEMAANLNRPLRSLPTLTESERYQQIVEWNDTDVDYLQDCCVHELFEEQAARTPDAAAVTFKEKSLTYGQLNARANQLAHYLIQFGVGPEVLVGLCIDRSLEMVVGLLGVLKAGAAYVPIDPGYPLDRLAFMLEDSQVSVLLSRSTCMDALPGSSVHVMCLDLDWWQVEGESESNPKSWVDPDNLAYVIYTSGTTGRPKGAMVRHGGLTNYLRWAASAYDVASGEGSPLHSSLSFDLTVTSLFPALLTGGRVELLAEDEGMEALGHALSVQPDFSLVKITPAHLELLSLTLPLEKASGAARSFIIGGDALFGEQLRFWRKHAPHTRLINEYGPTETVVGCCVYECDSDCELGAGGVPIGRPIANTRLYVLDGSLRPVPLGVSGELYIGGAGLGRGYLNRADLTAERFVPDPFSGDSGERLYRTGDLVRYRSDANLEYLGRLDHQVKIRGFRIELGEIESALLGHVNVQEATVLAREDAPGDRRLVAYVVSEAASELQPRALQDYLKKVLPEYMIPSAFVVMEQLPLTHNGKVDRKALPAPDANGAMEDTYIAPRTPIEEGLAGIWQAVLNVVRVGIEDSFFDLGGHSLLAIQVISRIRNRFQIELPLHALFDAPTVAGLSTMIEESLALRQQQEHETLARLLAEIEQLSVQEAAAHLTAPEGPGNG